MIRRVWTPAEVAQLSAQYPHMKTRVIAAMLGRSVATVYQTAQRLGLCKSPAFFASPASGRTTGRQGIGSRFVKGQESWNKGSHFNAGGRSVETQFRPGQMPHNWKPVGSTRINSEGFRDIKIDNTGKGPKAWTAIHRLNWIAVHGPVPKGFMLRFRDGNRLNALEENLQLVTRKEHLALNWHERYPKAIRQIAQLRGAIKRQINKREGKTT